jgi:nicotinate-nucleotide adenylyltransferase
MVTGLYFGSFNPIHIGHLAIANYMLVYGGLAEVWFVVSPHNPLKAKSSLLPQYQRLEMVNLAISGFDKFKASSIEFNLPQPNYTVDTLAYLDEKFPKRKFALIMGEDNLATLNKWKNHEIILEKRHILAYPRPGCKPSLYHSHPNVTLVNAPNIEVSSSFIREAVKHGHDIRFFVPPGVWEFVQQMNLYKK